MKTEDTKALAESAIETLAGQLESGQSAALTTYLAAMARFHRYSINNVLLIQAQCPGATRVAGFATWRQLGRFVRRGEKGIAILVPIAYRRHDADVDREVEASDRDALRTIVGFKAGYEAVMVMMGKGIATAYPQDQRANPVSSLPLMRDVRDYSSFALLVSISAGYPGTKEWVQQVNLRFGLPMVSGCTAVSAPEYYPYLQSGQLRGLLGGMAGAAEYEKIRGEKGTATQGMDAQSLAHAFVALCILAGNLVQWDKRRRERP